MAKVRIKPHTRKTKTGVVRVEGYDRTVEKQVKKFEAEKPQQKKFMGFTTKSLKNRVRRVVRNKNKASRILKKYDKYPNNLSVMVAGKWKNVNGKPKIQISEKQLGDLVKENGGLLFDTVRRYYYRSESDRKSANVTAITALYEALNAYGNKFDPKDPSDIAKHIRNYVTHFIKEDAYALYSVDFSMPMKQKLMFNRYKVMYDKYQGNIDKIYDELAPKKGDLYPSLDAKEANEKLPRGDYVTIAKKGVVEKKLATYKEKIKAIKDEYNEDLKKIDDRQKIGLSEDQKDLYEEGVKELERNIAKLKEDSMKSSKKYSETLSKLNGEIETLADKVAAEEQKIEDNPNKSNKTLLSLSKRLGKKNDELADFQNGGAYREILRKRNDLNKEIDRLNEFKTSLKPTTEEDIEGMKSEAYESYSAKMKAARAEHLKDMGRTQIMGFDSFVDIFNNILSMRKWDVNKQDDADGNLESQIAHPDELVQHFENVTELDQTLSKQYHFARERLSDKINMLDESSREVLKMRLGLHEKNEVQPHGLWGYPMNISQVAANMPDRYFMRDAKKYQISLSAWQKNKPKKAGKTKKTTTQFKRDVSNFKKKQAQARKLVAKESKGLGRKEAAKVRASVYKKMGVTKKDRPTKFKQKTQTDYKKELASWKKSKPVLNIADSDKKAFVSKKYDLASGLIRNIVKKNDVYRFINLHNEMIDRGLELKKSETEYELSKVMMSLFMKPETLNDGYYLYS